MIRSELVSQPADDTHTLHSFVGGELCGFDPVSDELARKLKRVSAPRSYVLVPIPTTLLKTYLDDVVTLICRTVEEKTLGLASVLPSATNCSPRIYLCKPYNYQGSTLRAQPTAQPIGVLMIFQRDV